MSDKNFLLAILLVTSSSKGHSIVFRWPSQPQPARRLSRPLPRDDSLPDYSWRASHYPENIDQALVDQGRRITDAEEDGLAYEWNRPTFESISPSGSRPSSGRSSPNTHGTGSNASFDFDQNAALEVTDEYDSFLGYSASTLASSLLRADRSVANRKFELQLDELLFIGHPMHIGEDNTWQWDSLYAGGGRRGTKKQQEDMEDDAAGMPSFQGFHLVLVLDRPEICRAGASNLLKYLDVYYQEVALKLTAGLHYEQARTGYVEKQSDLLMRVKETCSNNGMCPHLSQDARPDKIPKAIRSASTRRKHYLFRTWPWLSKPHTSAYPLQRLPTSLSITFGWMFSYHLITIRYYQETQHRRMIRLNQMRKSGTLDLDHSGAFPSWCPGKLCF